MGLISRSPRHRPVGLFLAAVCGTLLMLSPMPGQTVPSDDSAIDSADTPSNVPPLPHDDWLAEDAAAANSDREASESSEASKSNPEPQRNLNLLWLFSRGGPIIVVLAVLLSAVIAIGIDRWFATRESRLIPRGLLTHLGNLTESKQGLDPSVAYLICQDHPSPAATVLRAMLLKVGRPQAEVDRVASDAAQREAARLYAPARWLTVIAGVSPLLGLVGTIWGLIQAFYESTQIAADQNRASFLAGGIYEALVTTLGGLLVAIPAGIVAHYFETRIESAFHRIEELVLNLAPHLERFEGMPTADSPPREPSAVPVQRVGRVSSPQKE